MEDQHYVMKRQRVPELFAHVQAATQGLWPPWTG